MLFAVLAVNCVVCSIRSHWCCLQYWLPMVLSSVLMANGVVCRIVSHLCLQYLQPMICSTQLAASGVGPSNTAVNTIAIVYYSKFDKDQTFIFVR